jgi:hypothetical protein
MLSPQFPINARVLSPAGFGTVVAHHGKIRTDGTFRWIWWRYAVELRGGSVVLMPGPALELNPLFVARQQRCQSERIKRRLMKQRAAVRAQQSEHRARAA